MLLENSDILKFIEGGKIAKAIIEREENKGYNVHDSIINARGHGLPQNRPRYWIISARKDKLREDFEWQHAIEQVPLKDVLFRRKSDHGQPHFKQNGRRASHQVNRAATEAGKNNPEDEWIIAEHCSKKFTPNPKSQWI